MRLPRFVFCIPLCVALGACQSLAHRVSDKEDLLAASGFNVRPANTPKRLASLQTLPANKFVPKTKGDRVEYIYADPLVCNCLYVGDQKAYNAYKEKVFTRKIVNQQQLNAAMYREQWNWGSWDWGAWGDGDDW